VAIYLSAPPGPLFRSLGPVLRTPPVPAVYSRCIQSSSNDVVSNARKILDSPPPHQNNRVLLEGMTHSGDISVDFIAVRQPNAGHFTKSGVGLLGSRGKHAQAHSPPLRALGQIRRTGSRLLGLSAFAYQLLNRRHATSASFVARLYSAAVVLNIFVRATARQFLLPSGFVRHCSLQKILDAPSG